MLDQILASKPLAIIVGVCLLCAGWVLRMVYDLVKESILDWVDRRREPKDDQDATRILAGLHPETYDSDITNEEYFAAGSWSLSDTWRNWVQESAPRSPEIVAEATYRDAVWTAAYPPVRAEVNRAWPEWTEDEKLVVGRHRAENREGQAYDKDLFDALLTQTGSIPVVRKELVSV
jgi:hypothetical protein